ncbi:MAG: outer membrane protein assembly factor BamB family protein [Anaerolineae bacterium]
MSRAETQEVLGEQTPPPREDTLPPGYCLEGRYEVIRVLGVGGMSAVYQARDLRFRDVERLCAVKEMNNFIPDPRIRQTALQAFRREAQILASLSHPAIPKIYDYFSEGSRSYLVLELIQGKDLETLLRETTDPLPVEMVVDWGSQICDVLAYLHQNRPTPVIFRDLKPSNIMLNQHQMIVLIDFGIAKLFQAGQRGTMVGTEGYSPPEQYRGMVDTRGDFYALGATLHHLLTRQDPRREPPFSFHERPIRAAHPGVSEELEAAIMKALEYEADARYQTAGEMKAALQAALRRSVAPSAPSGPLTRSSPSMMAAWEFLCEDEVRSSACIAGDRLFVGCYDNNLYALNVHTGQFLWKYATEGGIPSSPAVWKDSVLVGSEDRFVYAVHAEQGTILWTAPTEGGVRSSPRVAYDHVFVGSDDGCLYALHALTGRVAWKARTLGPVRSTPLVDGELVFFGSEDGTVYALDIRNGETRWRFHTSLGVTSSPGLFEQLVIVGSKDHHLYALDRKSGWAVWRYRARHRILSSPCVWENRVFVGCADGELYALEADSGRLLWKFATEGQITSSPKVADEAVYFGSVDGGVYSVDARNGKLRWRFQTGGAVVASPAIGHGLVFIGSTDHKMYALPL